MSQKRGRPTMEDDREVDLSGRHLQDHLHDTLVGSSVASLPQSIAKEGRIPDESVEPPIFAEENLRKFERPMKRTSTLFGDKVTQEVGLGLRRKSPASVGPTI